MISIFNDVLGPVMRGPSSSHCAAALRIGRLARDLMAGDVDQVLVEFDRKGALATTHETQGSDMGLFGGLLGWEADDERLPDSAVAIQESGTRTQIEIVDSGDPHPSTYRLSLRGPRGQHSLVAISTGGGIVEIIEIDGLPVSIGGDYRETLIFTTDDGDAIAGELAKAFDADEILVRQSGDRQLGSVSEPRNWSRSEADRPLSPGLAEERVGERGFLKQSLVQVKAQQFVSEATISGLQTTSAIRSVHRLAPVVPVMSRKNLTVPFSNCDEMFNHDGERESPLWQLAVEYEMERGQLGEVEVLARMTEIVRILRRSIQQGIDGTEYQDRILGHQSGVFKLRMDAGQLLAAGTLNRIVLYVTALMEVKSSMGVIVARPTAGACGAVPGACVAVADELGLPDEAVAKAMLAAGLIGVFIATRSTFAAEVAGCQAECGAAASMAAAALVTLGDGNTSQAVAAASMALQSSLGMICDPVASRVEVPCLGKNVLAASNALSSANMALADYDAVIPLDEAIETADRVGRSLPRELRCTALGGLSVSKTAQEIATRLADHKSASQPD